MATTEKVFRDLLCEGRSLPAETSDPAGARTIDELRKQVKDLRAELEGAAVKSRQLVRDHEKELRVLREESERKLETTVESLTLRKDQERMAEVKKVEERLDKQKESELRMSAKDHTDEIRRLQRKFQHEKEEGIRVAVEDERRHYHEEFLHVLPEDEVMAREARLTKELFVLTEQNEQLEEQVKNLTRENRAQIELLRRMKHEYSMEVESVVKQNKIEASRWVGLATCMNTVHHSTLIFNHFMNVVGKCVCGTSIVCSPTREAALVNGTFPYQGDGPVATGREDHSREGT